MPSVWYVTAGRTAVDWSTALVVAGDDYRATVDIYRLTRDGADDQHERVQLWAKAGSRVLYWSADRAKREQSVTVLPGAYPQPAGPNGGALATDRELAQVLAQVTSHTHPASAISDSTSVGRQVLTAVDATAARTAIGAGTSNLALGSGAAQAAAGNHAHTAAGISDSTVVGRSVLTAADATAARTAIGAGTSNLALGSGAAQAAAGNHAHTAAAISDSTVVGRSVLTAADATAARTAIGAGTSSLGLGTTSSTAKAGDYAPPSATSSVQGLVQLAGDLAGTAAAPTVPGKASRALTQKAVTAAYTLVAGDATDVLLHCTAAAAVTITLPADAGATIAQEVAIPWRQYGVGQVTFAAGSGATLLSRGSATKSVGQYAEGVVTKVASNTWLLSGDVTV